ncbi:hypothetical protein SA58113_p20016 (plasmid) [Staphylococcus argenteus]|uniref:hypothetical protein n=1 Tax=Staphylococcus argenteus TaxID=985002 RepID=UPI000E3353E6|nr:hypothetical protein [Staphylococcus argenteus]BBD87460.1 hypothetical protein SA58113_p20016 [Staphylococcus argenteus]
MNFHNKKIGIYISELQSQLDIHSVYLKVVKGEYSIYQPMNKTHVSFNAVVLDESYPRLLIDDVMTLNQQDKYMLRKKIPLLFKGYNNHDGVCRISLKLETFKLKNYLKQLRKQGYKVVLKSNPYDKNSKCLNAIKKNWFSKKSDEIIVGIENDFIDVMTNYKPTYTIDEPINYSHN